jgi:hypothetical protein
MASIAASESFYSDSADPKSMAWQVGQVGPGRGKYLIWQEEL